MKTLDFPAGYVILSIRRSVHISLGGVSFRWIIIRLWLIFAPAVPALLAPGGVYIVSGIIDTREEEVQRALKACGFAVEERHEQGGWLCLACRRA